MNILKNEKLKIIIFYTFLTVVLTWPAAWDFFSSVPSHGADTMQVIGIAGDKANLLNENGVISGTLQLIKRAEFNMTAVYAYFQLIFGRVVGYNILFFLSFILSGFGAYLLANYYIKNKQASLLVGVIFAFSPFHIHNALSTNVGTMHQEWLSFFALYLAKFFEDLKIKYFVLAGLFLVLIGFSEHQLLAFTVIFMLFFLFYKLIVQPKIFLQPKFWLYVIVSAAVLSVLFFFMFQSLFKIAGSENNYLDAGFKSAVKYSNDALSIFVPPNFHTFWPNAFSETKSQFERNSGSYFSVYLGYFVLFLSLMAFLRIRYFRKINVETQGIFFWLAVAVGFYILSLGPYLHWKGVLEPPVKMPYIWIYNYLPFYKNIRTVGRFFVWSMLGFSMLAGWGVAFFMGKLFPAIAKNADEIGSAKQSRNIQEDTELLRPVPSGKHKKIFYSAIILIIILEFLAIPFKTDSLTHSSFYEKIGADKENYSVLEVPGSTDYDFASRDLVWKSIHRKNTINGYDFARVIGDHYTFQRGTPIIRTLLYDIPSGDDKQNDTDVMKDSYYSKSSEILNYYNIRYVVLDRAGLKGSPKKEEGDQFYLARSYVKNVLNCVSEHEDEYLYACEIDRNIVPRHMFLAMDYSNPHWVGKSVSKNGLQRWAENGAGLKLVNMADVAQDGKLNLNVKVRKPLRFMILFNGLEVYNKYMTALDQKQYIQVELKAINPGENEITFGVLAADNSQIISDKKSDTATIYQVEIE